MWTTSNQHKFDQVILAALLINTRSHDWDLTSQVVSAQSLKTPVNLRIYHHNLLVFPILFLLSYLLCCAGKGPKTSMGQMGIAPMVAGHTYLNPGQDDQMVCILKILMCYLSVYLCMLFMLYQTYSPRNLSFWCITDLLISEPEFFAHCLNWFLLSRKSRIYVSSYSLCKIICILLDEDWPLLKFCLVCT